MCWASGANVELVARRYCRATITGLLTDAPSRWRADRALPSAETGFSVSLPLPLLLASAASICFRPWRWCGGWRRGNARATDGLRAPTAATAVLFSCCCCCLCSCSCWCCCCWVLAGRQVACRPFVVVYLLCPSVFRPVIVVVVASLHSRRD